MNGFTDRIPCQVRRLNYKTEWVVRPHIAMGGGKTVRMVKSFLDVYDDFLQVTAKERARREDEARKSPWVWLLRVRVVV